MTRPLLNVDLGELPDELEELYALADVANIACGGHAGSETSMSQALALALAHGCVVAAHPSYPDRVGFGRASLSMDVAALARSVAEQCESLARIAAAKGITVITVKPHGALYHDASRDPAIAEAVIEGSMRGLDATTLTFVGAGEGALAELARSCGHGLWREGFADRRYLSDGTLAPRREPSALITDPTAAAEQARRLWASRGFDTLCVHGDTAGAVEIARAVRRALEIEEQRA